MTNLSQTLILSAISLAMVTLLGACRGGSDAASAQNKKASASESATAQAKKELPQLSIATEDVLRLRNQASFAGPAIIGSLQPERKADLRAEVATMVLQVVKENGEFVKKGDVIARLDETAIRDAVHSANEAVKNAELAHEQADKNWQRLKTLRASGMTSLQALDEAEVRKNAALSEISAAKARRAQAQQQLQRTIIRAPFDGIVIDRKVSNGDTASPGKEIVKVIDPNSMRFAGRISAEEISQIKIGQAVSFRVNGYPNQVFTGAISRIAPAANDITRQMDVWVDFSEKQNPPKVAGLYAEGNVEVQGKAVLKLPENAILHSGEKTYTLKIINHAIQKTEISLGQRDSRTGEFEIQKGLSEGDIILRHPYSSIQDGQKVEFSTNKNQAANADANASVANKIS